MASLSSRLMSNKRFEFVSTAFDRDKFAVVNMQGFESLSKTFRFTLTLVTDDATIDFDQMLQNPATFSIFAPDGGGAVPYHGVLAGFDQLHRADGYVFYRAVLVPHLWRLSLYRVSEVYLNEQTIPSIIEGLLKGARLPASAFELKLTGDYRPRSFVCQYQETHLDFLSRWMEKEGMYYWFDHGGRAEKLIIGDHRMMHAQDAIKVSYRPADELDTGAAADAVQGFVCKQKPLPYQVILQDFNYRKAAVELKVSDIVSENGFGDVMIYGENFRNEQEGKRYARLRAEEIACGGKLFAGDSTAVGLRSGYFMELAQHYREDFNGKYLVTEITHEGSQAGALLEGIRSPYSQSGAGGETNYHNTFVAIRSDVQFRPERVTPKPRVAGTMNATIDGEGSGEYAELDEFGQYKVQLPFDQSDKNANKGSARVRMATPYSGSNHGMHFPLHKNAEVLLSFTDGDPDQPVILGAVPNSENVSLVNANSATENRISTKGGNQMHMSDVKGKEVIWLNSPFHHSSIGIGSVDPKGGGSIYSATKGSSDSVSFGNSNSMSFGSKNSLSAGTASSLDLSIANKVSIGASISIGLVNDIKWNMNLNPLSAIDALKEITPKSFTIDDSSSAKFVSESTSETALESYSISAGHADLDPLVATAKTAKRILRTAIGAYTTVNLAASTVFSMGVNGQLKDANYDTNKSAADLRRDELKKKRDADKASEISDVEKSYENKTSEADVAAKKAALEAINKKYAALDIEDKQVMTDSHFVGGWPGIITKFGVDAIANTAAMVAIQGAARVVTSRLKAAARTLVSKMSMDKTGIKMTVDLPLGALPAAGPRNSLSLDADGVNLKASDANDILQAKLHLHPTDGGVMSMSAARRVHVSASQTGMQQMTQKIVLSADAAAMQAGPTNKFSATATEVGMATAAASVKLTSADATMAASTVNVKVTATAINLNSTGGMAQLGPTGVTLNGAMIQLG